MKNLFNKYDLWNDEALKISKEVTDVVMSIVERYHTRGYKIRDIFCIIELTVNAAISEMIYKNAYKKLKEDEV